jgi:hypothetical protein
MKKCDKRNSHISSKLHTIYIIIIISIQPLGRFWQEPEPSQLTGMALAHCILGRFLGVVCHCFPLTIYISYNNGRHPVTKTFTSFHYTSLHLSTFIFFLFKLHLTKLHSPLIWLNPNYCSINNTQTDFTRMCFDQILDIQTYH